MRQVRKKIWTKNAIAQTSKDSPRSLKVKKKKERKMGEELGERITTETLRKIASNEEYAENEMLCVAEYLIDLYEYDAEAHFGLVVSDEPAQCGELDKLKELDVRKEPFFLIYSKAARHWVCLAVTYLHNSVVVLYKDSLGVQIPHTLRDAIGNCLQSETVRFESHRGTEQNDENSSGPICLRNLQVLMKGLKSDTIKVPLVEKFQKVRFCTQYGVQNVKREFRLWLQKYLLGGLEALCAELCSDPDYPSFRDEVGLFLDDCSRLLRETYLLSSAYTGLLKSEAKEKQQDPRHETDYKTMKAMKDARSAFYRNQEVSRSIKSDENDFVDIDDGHRVYNLDIQERRVLYMR
uniref:Ubiquitin-like protease family profile domain-containing protein n=1 Tax=Trichogramma kaykai TaxID=54128 RepID=A0ABD2X269_9HYME